MILRGRAAIAVMALVAAFVLWRLLVTCDSVEPEVAESLRALLAAEHARSLLPSMVKAAAEHDEDRLEADFARMAAYTSRIGFTSLTSRGGRVRFIVRAEITVDGQPPPLGGSVRYFQFIRSPLSGLVYDMEVQAANYHLPFMD